MPTDLDRIEDDWHAYQGLAKEQWPRIDLSTLALTRGRRDALIEAVEQAYDVSREQARREVGYWTAAAPRIRRERADARRAPTGNRWSGQSRPEVETRAKAPEGWRDRLGDIGAGAVAGPARQARRHPLGAMLLAIGLGAVIVQVARAGRN